MSKVKESSKKELVAEYFAANKDKKKVFVTCDNFLFPQYKHALDHADTLDESDSIVETFENSSYLEVETEDEA